MGLGVPIRQGTSHLISTLYTYVEPIHQILMDINPYSKDTEYSCVTKIVQGFPPTDISVLDSSPTLCTMLERCWDLNPSVRPIIKECIAILEAIIPRPESVTLPINSPEPVLQQLPDQMLDLSAWDIVEHPEQLLTTASPPISSISTPNILSTHSTQQLWDESTEVSSLILRGHTGPVFGVAFSPDGSVLASGGSDSTLKMWDMDSGTLIVDLNESRSMINGLAFAPSGRRIATGHFNSTISIWDASSEGSTVSSLNRNWTQAASLPVQERVRSVAFSPDALQLASGGEDGQVKVHDPSSGALLFALEGHTKDVYGVAFSPNGEWLASGSHDNSVRIWNASTDKPHIESSNRAVVTLKVHEGPVNSISFSSNGKWLASGSSDGTVQIWKVTSWAHLKTLKSESPEMYIMTVDFSPDSARLACGDYTGRLHIWDTNSWARVMTWDAHINTVWSVTFSPDGKRLASGSSDWTVRIWQPKSKTLDASQ